MKLSVLLVCVFCMEIPLGFCNFNVMFNKNLPKTYRPFNGVTRGQHPIQAPKVPDYTQYNTRVPIDRANLDILHAYTAPNLSPIKHTNPGGFFSILMNGSEDDLDLALSQNAVLDTLADLLSIVGLKDLRDWLGIILMMFLLGPVLIPIVMLPAPTLALGALLVPLIWNSPPSAVNDNIAGHDPRIGDQEQARSIDSNVPNTFLNDFHGSKCVEMLTCEFTVLVRKIASSDTVSRLPKFEEDCSQYYCQFLNPVQRFLASNYFYIFGDGTKLYND